MKRLITGFAIGALALTLFVPQVSSNYAFAVETGAAVVVKDGMVNGTPVDQYILEEVANGRELSEIVSKLIAGGASAGDVVKAAIKAGINPATAAGVVTKAAPDAATDIVTAAILAAAKSALEITQAVINEAPASQTEDIQGFAVLTLQDMDPLTSQVLLQRIENMFPASKS